MTYKQEILLAQNKTKIRNCICIHCFAAAFSA